MRNQKGQALVETALVIPLLLLLIMGLFEFGRVMYIKNTLNNAARTGVRAAVVTTGLQATSTPQTLNNSCTFSGPNKLVYQLICNSIYNGIPKDQVTVNIAISDLSLPTGLSAGDSVTATLTWGSFKFVTPLAPLAALAGGSSVLNLDSIVGEASMRYE